MTRPDGDVFEHLARMSDHRGLFEHADRTQRRVEHGYCTDDNARMLLVTSRAADVGEAARLSRLALAFVLDAQDDDGRVRNRMDVSGRWTDEASTDDCWGRSLWGLGVAATQHGSAAVRSSARAGFDAGAQQRSPWVRAMAFAALGAADVLADDAHDMCARRLLVDAVDVIGLPGPEPWRWPEDRLAYANASLAEAVIAAGSALADAAVIDRGLVMLGWLLGREMRHGHLSMTGVGGRGPADTGAQFDQQPIEVAAMADACARAETVTGDTSWRRGIELAAGWFLGANDAGAVMWDPATGGGYDGLHAHGANLNEGTESTLALIVTLQRAWALEPVPA